MDFQYCDRCGEMMSADNNDSSSGEVLCATCRSTGAPAANTGAATDTQNAPSAPSPKPSPQRERLTLSGVMESDGLDLFSHDTIAMRKDKVTFPKPPAESAEPGTPLQMNIEDALGDPLGEGAVAPQAPESRPIPLSEMGSLVLPPAKPAPQASSGMPAQPSVKMVAPTQTPEPAPAPAPSPQQQLPGDEFFSNSAVTAPAAQAPAGQQAAPAVRTSTAQVSPEGDRWRVDCVHCSAKLALPVVKQKSKLRCPRCTQVLIIMPTGQIRGAQTQGSLAIPKGSETFAQFDMGSTATRREQLPNAGTPPPATPPGVNPPPNSPAMSFDQFSAATDAVEQVSRIVRPDDNREGLPSGHGIVVDTKPAAPASQPPSQTVDAGFDTGTATATMVPPIAATATTTPPPPGAEEHDHATALLGPGEPPVQMAPPRPRAFTTVPVDTMVLWILIAALPTFAGLMLASDIVSPRVEAICETIGNGVKAAAEGLYVWLGR